MPSRKRRPPRAATDPQARLLKGLADGTAKILARYHRRGAFAPGGELVDAGLLAVLTSRPPSSERRRRPPERVRRIKTWGDWMPPGIEGKYVGAAYTKEYSRRAYRLVRAKAKS